MSMCLQTDRKNLLAVSQVIPSAKQVLLAL